MKLGVSITSFKRCMSAYCRDGLESLKDKRLYQRPKLLMTEPRKNPSKMTKEELQDLVKDLAAENALLKKVKALVEKREAQGHATGSKPSKN